MKNIINLKSLFFLIIFLVGTISFGFAQNQKSKLTEFKLKVYFNDAKAKSLIEKELIKTEGVKTVSVDVTSKIVTFTFDPSKTDRLKINAALEKLGYETMITKNEKEAKKAYLDAQKNKAAPTK